MRFYSTELDIRKIAESGQCFRLNEISRQYWRLVAFEKVLHVRELCPCEYEFDCSEEEFLQLWHRYFDLDTDYFEMMKRIPSEDVFVRDAVEFGRGMRILQQEPWEMLISFIISQRKNILGIKKCIELLSFYFGEKLDNQGSYAFPTPEALSLGSDEHLGNCSLGYRFPYVRKAAQMVYSGELDLKALSSMNSNTLPDPDLLTLLLSVPGVGPKVAQCVMLFGFHRLDAFPVDVWIDRVVKKYYDGAFPMDQYPGFAGVIQQYIFYYAKKNKLEAFDA